MADDESSKAPPVNPEDGGALGTSAEIMMLTDRLEAYLKSWGLATDVAKDLAQDTLLTMISKARKQPYSSLQHKIGAAILTANNKLKNWWKKEARRPKPDIEFIDRIPAGTNSSPYDIALDNAVRRAISRQPVPCRELLERRLLDGMTSKEILAEIRSGGTRPRTTSNAIDIRIHRCLKPLRALFGPQASSSEDAT